jgi:hypothetical protein
MIKEGITEMRRTQLGSPLGASVALSSEQAPFTSEIVGSILATDSCEKSRGFSPGAPVSSHRES